MEGELTTSPNLEYCAGSERIGIFFKLPLFSSGNANLHNRNLFTALITTVRDYSDSHCNKSTTKQLRLITFKKSSSSFHFI